MKYCSTRGSVGGLSFQDALFSGYTSDGGLFVPEKITKLPEETVQEWLQLKPAYPKIVFEIIRLFVSRNEISDVDLLICIDKAYEKFDIPEIVGVKECKSEDLRSFKIAEMFHGPTASFKDYALSLVGLLMDHFIRKEENGNVTILVGTSGDTGSAAIKAVEGLKGVDIIVLYPQGKISTVQELQMNSSIENNVHVYAVEGTSDELDLPIRQSFPKQRLCSINSINWARILVQIAHFVYLYTQECKEGDELMVVLPTGAAGNASAGVIASLMGIPLKLYLATNENDNVHCFITNGELRLGGRVIPTPANAMDIRYPYNLERILYFFSSAQETAKYMELCESNPAKGTLIDKQILDKIHSIIPKSQIVTSNKIKEAIRCCWKVNHYMLCPHTATAFSYAEDLASQDPVVIISTASPLKFPEVVQASGIPLSEWDGEELQRKLRLGPQTSPNRSMQRHNMDKWFDILQQKIQEINK